MDNTCPSGRLKRENMKIIRIAGDFSEFPGGRYPEDGDGNGTTFREKFLVPAIESNEKVTIVLDGTRGYPSSFLEEAFGGLIRNGIPAEKIESCFSYVAEQPGFARFIDMISEHVSRAVKARISTAAKD